jgi:uncharacterized membrane protein YdjX (TVP38/TMEM64 family)
MAKDTSHVKKYVILTSIFIGILILSGGVAYQSHLAEKAIRLFHFLSDKNKISVYISAFGPGAPLIFMLIQILQVIFAPVPGEMTGFVGGYLFGTLKGFIFSSIALTGGSIINFSIGRILGKRFVRRLIPSKHLQRFDTLVKREGALIIFILFIFPGFPKDYLCLFLGLSAMPFKIFVWLSAIGRMPGTFILSLQGSMLYKENYMILAVAAGVCCLFVFLGYRYRESLFRWIESQNNQDDNG